MSILIIAGLCFLCVFFGALIRPLEWKDEGDKETRTRKLSKPAPISNRRRKQMNEQTDKIIKPFLRKDSFFNGSIQKHFATEETSTTWNDFRNLILSTPRYN